MSVPKPYLEVVADEPPVGSSVRVHVQFRPRYIGRQDPGGFRWPLRTRTEEGWVRYPGDEHPVSWEDLVGRLVHEAGRLGAVTVQVQEEARHQDEALALAV